jgi:hypothetical protein
MAASVLAITKVSRHTYLFYLKADKLYCRKAQQFIPLPQCHSLIFTDKVGVTTTEELDRSFLHPLVKNNVNNKQPCLSKLRSTRAPDRDRSWGDYSTRDLASQMLI